MSDAFQHMNLDHILDTGVCLACGAAAPDADSFPSHKTDCFWVAEGNRRCEELIAKINSGEVTFL